MFPARVHCNAAEAPGEAAGSHPILAREAIAKALGL
jgi:hypothetical protein